MIVFTVEDQGVGIPKDQQRRVFDRFESRSQGSGHRGAGLGLSIVKSLVELHGGTMIARLRARTGHPRDGPPSRAGGRSREQPLPAAPTRPMTHRSGRQGR